jgi:hypothetical protein
VRVLALDINTAWVWVGMVNHLERMETPPARAESLLVCSPLLNITSSPYINIFFGFRLSDSFKFDPETFQHLSSSPWLSGVRHIYETATMLQLHCATQLCCATQLWHSHVVQHGYVVQHNYDIAMLWDTATLCNTATTQLCCAAQIRCKDNKKMVSSGIELMHLTSQRNAIGMQRNTAAAI